MNSFWALQMVPHWSLLLVQNSQFTCHRDTWSALVDKLYVNAMLCPCLPCDL